MEAGLEAAARELARGALVVYPTDTLYGLGARATSEAAVARLLRAKGRPSDQPISFAVSSTEEIEPWADLTSGARRWVRRLLPGPVTVLLPVSAAARRKLASPILGSAGTVGIRVPDHPVARALALRVGPITCTSAIRHGEPASRSLAAARRTFGRAVARYVAGGPAPTGSPSTLVDLTGASPSVVPRASAR
ncbi:MAG: threonylcarbamoyl-AMP synthase [Thermoplasmata archaeon]|nr:threonylcarbamoyl-AMP synthase [Thermoplasmata archaeon]